RSRGPVFRNDPSALGVAAAQIVIVALSESQPMFKQTVTIAGLAAVVSSALVAFAPATSADSASLHVAIAWRGGDAACPTGYPPTTECHPHPGGPATVPGLGFVSQSYLFA